jgi:hypothetical protein
MSVPMLPLTLPLRGPLPLPAGGAGGERAGVRGWRVVEC